MRPPFIKFFHKKMLYSEAGYKVKYSFKFKASHDIIIIIIYFMYV